MAGHFQEAPELHSLKPHWLERGDAWIAGIDDRRINTVTDYTPASPPVQLARLWERQFFVNASSVWSTSLRVHLHVVGMLRFMSLKQTNRASPLPVCLFCFVFFWSFVCFCLYGPFNCISFNKFSQQLCFLTLFFLSYWSFQPYISLTKSPSLLI